MSDVGGGSAAVAAVGLGIIGHDVRIRRLESIDGRSNGVADTVRPSVVRINREAAAEPMFRRQDQTVVVPGPPIVDLVYQPKALPGSWICQ